jgi:hypothetical protein
MSSDWVKIYESSDLYKAEIYKGGLEAEGIKAITMNKKDSAYLFGRIELYVQPEDVIKAIHLINSIEQS